MQLRVEPVRKTFLLHSECHAFVSFMICFEKVLYAKGVVKCPQCREAKQSQNLETSGTRLPHFGGNTFEGLFDQEHSSLWRYPVPEQTGKSMTVMGTVIQNVGMRLFSWNEEIFAIYSDIQTQTILFPQKQRASILKKDQWTVIVLGFLRRVSFPVLHQLWRLFPWWKGHHLSICTVSRMISPPRPPSMFLYLLVFTVRDEERQ